MRYRQASYDDHEAIARLHAESWRTAYRGAYRDAFLDHDVEQDRARVWQERLAQPPDNQLVVLAEAAGDLVGFACAYGGEDPEWGTLLDNLHVLPQQQRAGVGARLVLEVAAWCRAHWSECGLYLWVLARNARARRFYQRLGARDRGGASFVPPGGGRIYSRRYAWATPDAVADVRRAPGDPGAVS